MIKNVIAAAMLAGAGFVTLAEEDPYAASDRWKLRKLCGRELYASFHPSAECSRWMNSLDWPMMKNLYQIFGHIKMPVIDIVPDRKEYARRANADELWKDNPLAFTTVLARNPKQTGQIDEFERLRPGMPYSLFFTGYMRPYFMPERLPQLDRASFRKWKKAHPAFHSFYAYDEWDNNLFCYSWSTPMISDPKLRVKIESEFPLTDDYRKRLLWTDKAQSRLEQFYFGENRFTGLVSTWATSCFDLARKGSALIFYEAELGSTSSPWRWGAAAIRGCSRQYDIPFGWYCATYMHEMWTRDGRKRQGFIKVKSPTRKNVEEGLGCSRSLLARNIMYGYFIGANVLQEELCWDFLGKFGRNGEYVPSGYAEDFNAPFAWNEKHERGTPYTPLAILVSAGEQVQRQHYVPHNRDRYSIFAFLDTLVPPKSDDPVWCCNRKKGEEGCMFNSEFGEIADILCPDAGQNSADFLKALKSYPRAVLVGNFDLHKIDTDALEQYVREGGTLYVEQRLVDLGYVSAWIRNAKGRLITLDSYIPGDFRTSKDSWWPVQMAKLTSGRFDQRVIREIYHSVQNDLMPVSVEGDIQWGVNKTSKGWLVWLINNKGVTRFAGEDQKIDETAVAHVKVTDKVSGRVFTVDVAPGGWNFVEID